MSANVELQNVSVTFGSFYAAKNVSVKIREGEFFSFLGPSGCGKTTLLRSIAGLQKQHSGTILLNDEPIHDLVCEQRGIGMLFQRPVLFPFKDVLGNILFAYKSKKFWNMDDVHEVMNEMGLIGKEKQSIETLSGGEAQRVVLARTLLTNPKLLLLDEPLSALDVDLRRKIALEIRLILKARGIPAIHVTHDPAEAEIIGDRVVHWNEVQPGEDDE